MAASPANGEGPGATRQASTAPRALCGSPSTRAISGRPRLTNWSAMPRRRGGTSAGRPPSASRRWYARWSTPIWRLSHERCRAATAMTDAGAIIDASYSLAGKRVWVAGYRGMVGYAHVLRLAATGCELLTAPRDVVGLRRQSGSDACSAEA